MHMVPAAVLTLSKPVSITAVRPVCAVVPKIMVTRPRHAHSIDTKSKSPIRRHITRIPSPKTNNLPPRVTAAQALMVNAAKGKKGKWVWRTKCPILDHDSSASMILKWFDYNDAPGRSKSGTCPIYLTLKSSMVDTLPLEVTPKVVFFLATKDETSPILKAFITGLENQLSLKVKVIKSDNGTEFKNSDLNQFCELKGIKREFSVPRTPQQNGIVEKKNRTLIEAARTMLADLLLPIPFWAGAVNTACYVHNRVLVTKPRNKTPYELLHGRTPIIGFMRPFGCLVTILNTLDPLGKFKGKVDEGFLVGYSVNSKSFRVFNSRTRIVQETLHVNFLENKPNIAGEKVNQQYVLFPMWSSGSTNPQNNDEDAAFDEKEHDAKKPESEVNVSLSSSAQSGKQDYKTNKKAKRKSCDDSFIGNRDLSAEFEDYSDNSSNDVNVVGSIVPTAWQNSFNSTNPFSAAGPLNTTASPTHEKYSFKDASQLPKNPDMLEMKDITYSDHKNVGAEADFNNLETSITINPIPTIRFHKDHPVSQIIGDLSLTTQTRSMTRVIKDQGGLSQIFNDDFHTCMFACFLLQKEPKRVHQALKDPSWIKAMQEELLQFQMQKVWILVDLPHGKRAIGFEDPDHPNKVYKVVKALYGLHQAPRA
nr:ribonuclease H-like domain-containing protein [Tanacetum cinerariifolium]